MRTKLFFAIFLAFSSLYANTDFNPYSKTALCLACEISNGLTVSDLTGVSATLSWNTVSGATQYTVEVQDEQNTPSTFHIETNVNSTSYSVTGLTAGVLYKFKVRTRCGGDKSDWSDWMFFTAGNGGGGSNTCDVPTGLTVNLAGGVATLGWTAVNGAVQYSIEVEDEQNVPSTFHLEDTALTNSYTLAGMQANVLYKFKVRTHCAGGQSDWSIWLFFNGNSGGSGGNGSNCAIPTGTQVSNINSSEALLTWNTVQGVDSYTLEIERIKKNAAPWQITQVVTNNAFLLTGLDEDTRYKFKVRSNCTGGGHSNWTKWRRFKTEHSFTGAPGSSNLRNSDPNPNESVQNLTISSLELKVWPNPVQANATVSLLNLNPETTTLRLFDMAGRILQEQQIQLEGSTWEGTLPLANMSNGLYLLQAKSGKNTMTVKLVVSH